MSRRATSFTIGAVLILIVGFGLLLHGSGKQPTTKSTAATQTNQVAINNFMFLPMAIRVHVGTTVTWTNQDTIQHSIVADTSSADAPTGPLLNKNQSYHFTFTKAGTYSYHCNPHLDMHGTVTVTN